MGKEKRASVYTDCTIYCLESECGMYQYVGATCNLKQRKAHHKYRCTNPISEYYHYNVYETIRQNGGYSSFKYRVLEELECDDRVELGMHEKEYIKMIRPNMNTMSCGIPRDEVRREYRRRNRV